MEDYHNVDTCPTRVRGCNLRESFFNAYNRYLDHSEWGASIVDVPFDCLYLRFVQAESRRLGLIHGNPDRGHDNAMRVAASWVLTGLHIDNPDASFEVNVNNIKWLLYQRLQVDNPELNFGTYEYWRDNSPTITEVFNEDFPRDIDIDVSPQCQNALGRLGVQLDRDLEQHMRRGRMRRGRRGRGGSYKEKRLNKRKTKTSRRVKRVLSSKKPITTRRGKLTNKSKRKTKRRKPSKK
jgi:hypothetical protein